MNQKISEQQKSKPAYIYVRQSTLAQVRHHQESTERQYALRQKALELGWSEPSTRILDRDLGISGAHTTGRTDFKTLVADVSMGQVGAVFALEASRLARSNADWHRLLELCALTRTLVIDEDGCYDPADFNDGLLLGLKGTMAQAELHFIRARLLGGKLHKAQKGELRFPLCGIVPRRGWPRAPYRFKSFSCNTYKKHEGRGLDYFMVNQESDKDHCREQPSGTKIDLCPDDVAPRITSHFHTGCRLPFRMLRFGVP